jgi:hypothetical protein
MSAASAAADAILALRSRRREVCAVQDRVGVAAQIPALMGRR